MATYNVMAEQNCGNIQPGSNWIYLELDFTKHNGAIGDVFRLYKLKNGWIVNDSYYKVQEALTTNGDLDIGYSATGATNIVDLNTHAAGAWVRGSDTPAAQQIFTANEYVTVTPQTANISSGKVAVLLQVIAPHDLAEPLGVAPF
jgi:hypothetical protein